LVADEALASIDVLAAGNGVGLTEKRVGEGLVSVASAACESDRTYERQKAAGGENADTTRS
jgi:hypothetical protein